MQTSNPEKFLLLPKNELDFQLSPSLSAKNALGVLTSNEEETQFAYDYSQHHIYKDVAYGDRERQKLDYFIPHHDEQKQFPCFIFIHGGFWQEGSKTGSGFPAISFTSEGYAYISVGYTLTPDVSLSDIVEEINQAISYIIENAEKYHIDKNRLILSGHSAGAHLAACILTNALSPSLSKQLCGAVLISGVYELLPIQKSYVNEISKITDNEVNAFSPVRLKPGQSIDIHIIVGSEESDSFQLQSTYLFETWKEYSKNISIEISENHDHFDILHVLKDKTSKTRKAITQMSS